MKKRKTSPVRRQRSHPRKKASQASGKTATGSFRLEIKSDPREIRKVEPFLMKVNKTARLDDGTFYRLLVASTEAVNNGILHGNKSDTTKKVTITCDLSDDAIVIHITDEGAGFKPENVPDPLEEENLLKTSGRGVFLMKSLMDGVKYEVTPGGTDVELTISLKLLH